MEGSGSGCSRRNAGQGRGVGCKDAARAMKREVETMIANLVLEGRRSSRALLLIDESRHSHMPAAGAENALGSRALH